MQDLPKWEYRFVGFMLDKKTADVSEHTLNREGENGWEIVAIMDGEHCGPGWHVALMKRLKR
jgi:hypothetical protein